jgi:3-O-methylgallate 3,4-dioxygenase
VATIVLGLGTSHSPHLSTPLHLWGLHVERDQNNKELHFRGRIYDFEQLSQIRAGEGIERELSQEKWLAKRDRCERGIACVGETLAQVGADVLVVIGDDQHELFLDDGMPAMAVYWGKEIDCIPRPAGRMPPSLEAARWANYGIARESYPCVSELGRHIVNQMMVEGFDVAQFRQPPAGRSIGHAFTFVRTRIMKEKLLPMVPILLNTYYPPNQPMPGRCYAFGKALRRAIESWDADKSVAIVASGGLSHFVVDEVLDRKMIAGMRERNETLLAAIPVEELNSGTSESRNWIAAAGALEHLRMELIDYIPLYRTVAGTGCGMAFARWC